MIIHFCVPNISTKTSDISHMQYMYPCKVPGYLYAAYGQYRRLDYRDDSTLTSSIICAKSWNSRINIWVCLSELSFCGPVQVLSRCTTAKSVMTTTLLYMVILNWRMTIFKMGNVTSKQCPLFTIGCYESLLVWV